MRRFRQGVVIGLVALAGMTWSTIGRAADPVAEAAAITALDGQWVAAVGRQDPEATVEFYAEDGAIMPPNAPIAKGHDAIMAVWQHLFGIPGFSLAFAPTKIQVSDSTDIAYEIGTYALSFDGDQGPVKDAGKYVVVWKKVGGAWKVAADIFNTDMPAQ